MRCDQFEPQLHFHEHWTCLFHESHTHTHTYAMSYFYGANMESKLLPRENKYQTKYPQKKNSTSTSLFRRQMEKSESQSKRKFAWISPAAITRRCACVCVCVALQFSPIPNHKTLRWTATTQFKLMPRSVGDTGVYRCVMETSFGCQTHQMLNM